jgi:hypothetical protein
MEALDRFTEVVIVAITAFIIGVQNGLGKTFTYTLLREEELV